MYSTTIYVCVCVCKLNCVQFFVTLLDGSLLGSSARGLPTQEHWSGLPFATPRDLPDPGTDPRLCVSALAGGFLTTAPPGKATGIYTYGETQNCLNLITTLRLMRMSKDS